MNDSMIKPQPPKHFVPMKKAVPWAKEMLPNQGPQINGSNLTYTCASDKSILMPEARV